MFWTLEPLFNKIYKIQKGLQNRIKLPGCAGIITSFSYTITSLGRRFTDLLSWNDALSSSEGKLKSWFAGEFFWEKNKNHTTNTHPKIEIKLQNWFHSGVLPLH